MSVDRRELLRTGVSLATMSGVAGVAAGDPTGGPRAGAPADSGEPRGQPSLPEYARWIPDTRIVSQPQQIQFVYSAATDGILGTDGDSEPPTDPMLSNPTAASAVAVFSWLGLTQLGIAQPVVGAAAQDQSVDPGIVPADRSVFFGQNTQLYLGSFDGAALQSAVDAGAFTEAEDGVYEHDDQDTVVTWTDGAVILGPTVGLVSTIAAAGAGEVGRRANMDRDYAWLLRTAGRGDFTVAWRGVDGTAFSGGGSEESDFNEDHSMFQGATGYAQSASVGGNAFTGATTAVQYESADDVALDDLESTLGTAADDLSTTQDAATVTLRGEYSGTGVGSGGGEPTDAAPGGATASDPGDGMAGDTADGSGDGSGGDGTAGDESSDDDMGGDGGDGSGDGGMDGNSGGDGGSGDSDGDSGSDGDDGDSGGSGPGMGLIAGLTSVLGGGYLLAHRSDAD